MSGLAHKETQGSGLYRLGSVAAGATPGEVLVQLLAGQTRGALAQSVARVLKLAGRYQLQQLELESSQRAFESGRAGEEVSIVGRDAPVLLVVDRDTEPMRNWVRALRRSGIAAPLMVLSTNASAHLAAEFLDAGADDFVALPLDANEFLPRLDALCAPSARTSCGELAAPLPAFALDARANSLRAGSWVAILRPTSFALVAYLFARQGQWVDSDELRDRVLNAHCAPGASNVRWHVLEARCALGAMSWWLHSDTRLGYMLSVESCERRHCARLREVGIR